MSTTAELADFLQDTTYDDLPDDTVDAVKKRLLDSIGIALGAVGRQTPEQVKASVSQGSDGQCTLWADGTTATVSGAAMYNTVLTRYLDFMDSFLAPGETPHPSDNIGTAVAAAERAETNGRQLLAAIAAAYEIQGELAWNAPVRDQGFDHVTHTVITQTAAASKVMGLDWDKTRNAIGIAGTGHNALRVTRTGGINEWKGIASGNAARNGAFAALLAKEGMDGPTNLFEGQKGWKEVIAGDFDLDLDPACTRVHDVMCKRYVAETYAQSAVEGIIELTDEHDIKEGDVESIHLDTFHGAKLIIGGGEGDRHEVTTTAEADHSLPYMLAVALLDRQLLTDQYNPERLRAQDVQSLLQRVTVEEDSALTDRFEDGEMPAIIDIRMQDGTVYNVEKSDFRGHPNNPMDWNEIEGKFESMAADIYGEGHRAEIVDTVKNLENRSVDDLVTLLE
jgi:2-methylcitrate dehydratase